MFKIHLLIGQQVPDPQQGQDQAPRTVSKGKEWIIKTLSSFALDLIIYESASLLYIWNPSFMFNFVNILEHAKNQRDSSYHDSPARTATSSTRTRRT